MTIIEILKKHTENFATETWAKVYEKLKEGGVKFPDDFDTIGACYGSARIINDDLIAKLPEIEKEIVGEIINKIKTNKDPYMFPLTEERFIKDIIAHLTNKDN